MVLKQEALSLLLLFLVLLFLLSKEIMLVQNEMGCLRGEIFIWVLLQSEQNL